MTTPVIPVKPFVTFKASGDDEQDGVRLALESVVVIKHQESLTLTQLCLHSFTHNTNHILIHLLTILTTSSSATTCPNPTR